VQGAGIHHNPTPGPAGEKFVYGHIWVTLAWLVRHPAWDTLALPLRALLYVRAKDLAKLTKHYPWAFRTKLELAVELTRWLQVWLSSLDKELWLVVDGAYAKRAFLRPVKASGLVVFSRLRKDADLRNVPSVKRRRGQRGPLPTYGKERIDLAKRAAQKRGWQQVACVQYGERVVKTVKSPYTGRIELDLYFFLAIGAAGERGANHVAVHGGCSFRPAGLGRTAPGRAETAAQAPM
jgi:hypothetical protein